MKVIFTVKYHTKWGERLFIAGSFLNDTPSDEVAMAYLNGEAWQLEIELPDSVNEITYHYLVENENGVRKAEDSSLRRRIVFDRQCDLYYLFDDWMLKPVDPIFYSSAFTKNIFARPACEYSDCSDNLNMVIRVRAAAIKPDEVVAISGNQPCLGNWNPDKAPHLSMAPFVPFWEIRLNAEALLFPLEYKFVVLDKTTNHVKYWEKGENRVIHHLQTNGDAFCIMINDNQLRTSKPAWKACGAVVPVFSLRSDQSFGIGDIGDIKKLIDWATMTNQHVIQILPMNDTTRTHTWKDSYPYSAISIFALHPLYINISMMGELNNIKKKNCYRTIQQRLNKKEEVDYQLVEKYKIAYYRDYFEQEKDKILTNRDFLEFIDQNREWLIPYGAFSYLRDKHHTADFTKWGDDTLYDREKAEMFYQPDNEAYHEFSYLFFIQFTLHKQMEAIACYARDHQVILKGDLPIGVNRESVETWTEPGYFNRRVQAGAPPDLFSEKGQNWSFPTYNWDVMKQDEFAWWKKRFRKLEQYFDCFRIDHILGFFRIWEIPQDYVEGLCGYFNPALPLQIAEIEQYGMTFDDRWLTPGIHIKYIPELFGDENISNLSLYLHHSDAEHLVLNENCSTQRKIIQLFSENKDNKSQIIKDGLMFITNEVLFIRDPYHPTGYHPRISAARSCIYRELSTANRQAFDLLYHDYFFNRHNDFWKQTAINRLQPLLKSTQMLVCGEDLGMIPATVHEVMDDLQILSLELEYLPKVKEIEFSDLTKLPYLSVCTTSTHDMNPLRFWWTENKEKTQRYYNSILHHEGLAPSACTSIIAEQIINNHLHASSMLTMIPLQDWLAIDDNIKSSEARSERINDPGNPDHYWRYRMHISLETLLQSTNFNEKLRSMIAKSGR